MHTYSDVIFLSKLHIYCNIYSTLQMLLLSYMKNKIHSKIILKKLLWWPLCTSVILQKVKIGSFIRDLHIATAINIPFASSLIRSPFQHIAGRWGDKHSSGVSKVTGCCLTSNCARAVRQVTYEGKPIRITADFWTTLSARCPWKDIIQTLEDNMTMG
jgi:hypothetical protein